jgi:hypothetical protein
MYGLAISLPKSTLLQNALRQSACAHMHIHTRMRASSDARAARARLAAARGLGRHGYRRWAQYRHGCISLVNGELIHLDSDFQVRGKLGWHSTCLANLNSRMAVRWRLRSTFFFAVTVSRVPAPAIPLYYRSCLTRWGSASLMPLTRASGIT